MPKKRFIEIPSNTLSSTDSSRKYARRTSRFENLGNLTIRNGPSEGHIPSIPAPSHDTANLRTSTDPGIEPALNLRHVESIAMENDDISFTADCDSLADINEDVDQERNDGNDLEGIPPVQEESPVDPHRTFSVEEQMGVELMYLCRDAHVSLKYYNYFLQWAKKYVDKSVNLRKVPSRKRLLRILKETFSLTPPQLVNVGMHGEILPMYDILDQLIDLLKSPYFQSTDNICVNEDETIMFQQYTPTCEDGISEVTCSSWYTATYEKIFRDMSPTFTDPETNIEYHNWLLPLIFYNDKTGTTAMESVYTLEPLVFTLGVIRRCFREYKTSWRHLGLIPPYNGPSKSSGEKPLSFHHECLTLLLKDLKKYQEEPPLIEIPLFGKIHRIRPILSVAFIIGDQLSQDQHCCRKQINAGGAGRIHRGCFTSFLNADKPPSANGCIRIKKKVFEGLCEGIWLWEEEPRRASFLTDVKQRYLPDDEELKEIEYSIKLRAQISRDILEKVFSLYPIHNAWSAISFGSTDEYGVYRATLDDPMHYNLSGLFEYVMKVAFLGLVPKEAENLEKYFREDFSIRSSVRYDLPRGSYTNGFTNCTSMTASQRCGLIYSLYLSLKTNRVRAIYQTAILRQQKKYLTYPSPKNPSKLQNTKSPTNTNPSPQSSTLMDQYFFKETSQSHTAIPRKRVYVLKILNFLNKLGILKFCDGLFEHFDNLHVEYLLQIGTDRYESTMKHSTVFEVPYDLWGNHQYPSETVDSICKCLFSKLRKGKFLCPQLSPPTENFTIQKKIKKHWINKPKVSGTGDTSAVLTDVDGLSVALEGLLIFHSIVHDFHEHKAKYQKDTKRIREVINQWIPTVLDSIYRGDNSCDVKTCKCHAHYHLVDDIESFGAPMGFDAGQGERNLKGFAKNPSKTARKCGLRIFMEQTSHRILEDTLLECGLSRLPGNEKLVRSRRGIIEYNDDPPADVWKYTRKECHALYNTSTGRVLDEKLEFPERLLTSLVMSKLKAFHGNEPNPSIKIWKEISIQIKGEGTQSIRAFSEFDQYGPFFDYVQVAPNGKMPTPEYESSDEEEAESFYTPAKVMLLYQTHNGDDLALVWMAKDVSDGNSKKETHISATWTMEVCPDTWLPLFRSINMSQLIRCISVQEHWKNKINMHHPSSSKNDLAARPLYSIVETYPRRAWSFNAINRNRWVVASSIKKNKGNSRTVTMGRKGGPKSD